MTSVFPGKTDVPRKSYITTEAPNGHIYSYTKSYNDATYTWSGLLTPINFTASPYSAYNVAGIVLRETGKKLYPDANPGVDRYMVGVFIVDQEGNNVSNSLGSMFIDPNCSVFAQFNGQRPIYVPTAEDDLAGNGLDLGNPVYTRGNITTVEGSVVVSSQAGATGSVLVGPSAAVAVGVDNAIAVNATATVDNQIITSGPIAATTANGTITAFGNIVTTNGGITAALPIRSTTVVALTPGANVTVNPALGQVFTLSIDNITTNVTTVTGEASSNNVPGQVIYIIVTGTNPASTIDFGNGFRSQSVGILNMGVATVTISFVSDGVRFYEISRTGALAI